MEFLTELWMPIAVSAVFVWIASAITHMVLPHHKNEWKGLQNEDQALDALRSSPPGQYMFPFCTMAEMNTPEYKEKVAKGPVGVVTIWPGQTNMGKNLALTLLFYLVVGVFVAYVAWHALGKGAEYMTVFRIAGTAAFMAHGLGWMPNMIWFGGKGFWSYLFDSIVYALITAGTFGWLWAR
ncbi:MAG: hypothetical protein KIT74_01520 [Fimbriimonadales bacterium]|nr:hypothetical protein [Fimbriimonadales bacterium]